MNTELKAEWLRRLRSGEYKQDKNYLRTDSGYCCLGVLADAVPGVQWDKKDNWIACFPNDTYPWTGLIPYNIVSSEVQSNCVAKNDAGETFAQIADWLEVNV